MEKPANQNNGVKPEHEPREGDIEESDAIELAERSKYDIVMIVGIDVSNGLIRSAGTANDPDRGDWARRLRLDMVRFISGYGDGFSKIEPLLLRIAEAIERRNESDTVGH